MKQYHSFDNKHTDTEYRKLVLFVCDICVLTNNRLPHTIPTIVDNDADLVYGVICYQTWSMSDDKMAEYHTFLNSILQCVDFVIEIDIASDEKKRTLKDVEAEMAAITTDIAINGPQPDIDTNNVRFVHCKCDSVKVSNAVVVQIGEGFNIAEAITRNSPPRNVKTLLLDIGFYTTELSSYYFNLLGLNGNCGVGYTRGIDFCQYFVDTHLDKIRECLKLLLTDNPDLPKSTFTDDIEPFIMYTGH